MIKSERRGKEILGCVCNSLSVVVTIYTAFFNIQEFCISPTRSMCVCISCDYQNQQRLFPSTTLSVLFCNEDVCFLRGRSYIFRHYLEGNVVTLNANWEKTRSSSSRKPASGPRFETEICQYEGRIMATQQPCLVMWQSAQTRDTALCRR